MQRAAAVAGLVLVLSCWASRGNGAVTITESKVGDQPMVVIENDFLRMAFEPAKGGECTGLLYKPTNKRFVLANEGSLLGSRVWNYADEELYSQWQKNPWEYEVKRAAGEVTLVMRAPGKVAFTRSTLFEKRITLREGEAMARVEHVFHVGQELMTPQKIGLWFFNQCGVVGEPNLYCFPLDDGIVAIDPTTAGGESWHYNPSRGWAAVVSTGGDGLCFNMEYRRLMCFYLWAGRQSTFEWAFRTTDIANGDSLRTEELIIPFAGLKRVHGAGGGIVAGFEAPGKCTLAEAQKGLPVKALVTTGTAQTGELTVDWRQLPEGPAQNVCRQAVSLQPTKVSATDFTVKAEREGTWMLTGHLSVQGKEITDFTTAVIVGAESAPVRIAAKEERIGRKTERFEDKLTVRGTAPKDIELSTAIESEHVVWAKPYYKGKLRVMVLTSCLTGREAVELAERMDVEIIWVTAGTQYELNYISGVFGPGKTYTVEHMNQYIKENLAHPCDAILIGGLRGDLFSDEVLDLFRRKVEEGVGLVYVAPNNGPDKLYDLLPVQKEVHPRRPAAEWRMQQAHFITIGVPFEELPKTDCAETKAKTASLATVGQQPLLVVQEGPGKGRVAVLNYNVGWQGSGNYKSGITPWLTGAAQKFKYWEYHFSLLAKSLLWAARREPEVSLQEMKVDITDPTPKLVARTSNAGAPLTATAEVKVSDAYGVIEHEASSTVRVDKGEGPLSLNLPDSLPGGLHLADLILKGQGKVVTWGSAAFRLDRGLTISKVAFDKKAYPPGETADVTAELSSPGVKEQTLVLRAEFSDSLGRLLARSEQKVSLRGTTSAVFPFPVGKPLATAAKVRVTAHRPEKSAIRSPQSAIAVGEADCITFPEKFAARAWDDWESCVWGTPAGAYERDYLIPIRSRVYKDYGINTVLASAQWPFENEYDAAVRAGFQIMPMNVSYGLINVGHTAPKGKMSFEEARTEYQKTHDKKCLVRPVCLNSPADLAPVAEQLRKLAEFCGWLEPIGYNLGDEMSITYYVTPFDYDFGDTCLGVFRDWLKERYRTIEALNQEWETNFASWDQVTPMTAYEVKERRNYAPWADHREFMDVTFAKFFTWVRDTLREKDPKATVGMSGSQAAEAYGGYDWHRLMHTLDFVQNYTHQDTIAMQRSFDGRVPRAPWYGYMSTNPGMREFLWRCLLNGNSGGSYFVDNYMFLPDLTMTQSTKDAAGVVKEFQGGLAKLLRNAERVNDIGVHYSHPSIRGAFISGADALFRDNRGGWVQSLQDLGYQCELLATPQIEAGELAKRNYRVFLLPYSVALSEKEAATLREYVQQGGLLIADAKVGLMDDHCRTLDKARLDDLFGVSRSQVDPLTASREGEARFTQDRGACKLTGLTLDTSVAEPDLKVVDGTALGQHGQTPVAVVKQHGKGYAVLVNLFLDSYQRRRELRIEEPMRRLVEGLLGLADLKPAVRVTTQASPAPHFHTVRYRSGEAEYVAVQLEAGGDKRSEPVQASITFPHSAFAYDVRKGEALGQKGAVTARLDPGDTKLYALLPYEVKAIVVKPGKSSARPGDAVPYTLSVQASGGQPGMHVFRVEVLGPDGKVRPHYGKKLLGAKGSAEGEVPLALNDAPGKWTLRVWDLATKKMGTAAFQMIQQELVQ